MIWLVWMGLAMAQSTDSGVALGESAADTDPALESAPHSELVAREVMQALEDRPEPVSLEQRVDKQIARVDALIRAMERVSHMEAPEANEAAETPQARHGDGYGPHVAQDDDPR